MCANKVPMPAAIAEVQKLLRYRFSDASLIEEALTHPSDPKHPSFKRLEFVGDAALGLAFTKYIFRTNPSLDPGKMSVLRAANVSNEKLARVAVRHSLYRFLRRNSPELDEKMNEFMMMVMIHRIDGLPDDGTLVKAPKVLANVVESIAAAVYIDCGFNLEKLWEVFRVILEPIITVETWEQDPVTALYLYCHKKGKLLDFNYCREESGKIAEVYVDGELLGTGFSKQKCIAKLNAARVALHNLSSSESIEMETDADGAREEKEDSYKQKLYKLCTKKCWPNPVYRKENEQGPSHDKKYICSVTVVTPEGKYLEVGDLKSKMKDSTSSAASKMLSRLSSTVLPMAEPHRGWSLTLKIFLFFLISMFFSFFVFPYE